MSRIFVGNPSNPKASLRARRLILDFIISKIAITLRVLDSHVDQAWQVIYPLDFT